MSLFCSSVSLGSVGCHDSNLLSSIFHEPGVGDTLMVGLHDTDAIYSVYNPVPSFTQYVPDISNVSVSVTTNVPDLTNVYLAPDTVSTVTLTLPDPVVTSDEFRLQILSRTWTPDLAQYLATGHWSDTDIYCAGGDMISAHRIILAAASPFLAHCLQMSPGEEDQRSSIILPDFSYLDVKEFLQVIYLNIKNTSGPGYCHLLQYLTDIDSVRGVVCDPHDYVKHEEKLKKLPIEIKMEASLEQKLEANKVIADKITEISIDEPTPTQEKKGHVCRKCGKIFKKARILKEHMNIHENPKFMCDFDGCSKKFRLKANLKAHKDVVHLRTKTIGCDVCGKLFYNQSQLRTHQECHVSDKHVCEHCSNIFSCSKSLKEHIKFKHSNPEDLPKCTVCHKTFSTPQNLKSHFSRIHMQEKKFVCSDCGKSFFEKAQLDIHLSSHNPSDLEIQCDVCKLKFKSKKTLYYHKKRIHNPSSKKHICYQCGKSYADSHHLNRHMETHGQKSSYCKTCGKGFQSEEKVKAHIRKVHEKWRKNTGPPKQCLFCDKTFLDFGGMKRHLKEVHKMSNLEANSVLVEKFNLDPKKHKMNPSEIIPELLSN